MYSVLDAYCTQKYCTYLMCLLSPFPLCKSVHSTQHEFEAVNTNSYAYFKAITNLGFVCTVVRECFEQEMVFV